MQRSLPLHRRLLACAIVCSFFGASCNRQAQPSERIDQQSPSQQALTNPADTALRKTCLAINESLGPFMHKRAEMMLIYAHVLNRLKARQVSSAQRIARDGLPTLRETRDQAQKIENSFKRMDLPREIAEDRRKFLMDYLDYEAGIADLERAYATGLIMFAQRGQPELMLVLVESDNKTNRELEHELDLNKQFRAYCFLGPS